MTTRSMNASFSSSLCSPQYQKMCGFSLFKLMCYLREEILICFAATSSKRFSPEC